VEAARAGEDAYVATARRSSVRQRGTIASPGAAGSGRAFPRAAAAAVHRRLVAVLDQVGARGRARVVGTESADAMGAAGACLAESALRRAAPAAVDVGLVAVPDAVGARARRAYRSQADSAGTVRRGGAFDTDRALPGTRAAAVHSGLGAVPQVVAAGRLLADATDAGQPACAGIVRLVADRVRCPAARGQEQQRNPGQ
jgi:hypothetical protein